MVEVLLVLGPHRSGISSVSGALSLLGAPTPKPLAKLHDELLSALGSTWDDWRRLDPLSYNSPSAGAYKRQAKEFLEGEFGEQPLVVLKDPRMCRFTPFWLDVLNQMGARSHAVIPVRSPLETAWSLKLRHETPLTKGLLLWLRHILDAELATRPISRTIFSWNDFLADWRSVAERISLGAQIAWPRLGEEAKRDVDQFVSNDLRHFKIDDAKFAQNDELKEWTQPVYEAMLALGREGPSGDAFKILDDIGSLFEQFSRLLSPLALDYEAELTQLRAAVSVLFADRDHWLTKYKNIETELQQMSGRPSSK